MQMLKNLRQHWISGLFTIIALSISLPVSIAFAEGQMVPIAGNHSPSVEKLIAPKPAPTDTMLTMSIDLNPTNRAELERLLAAQQDPTSPDYHRWLKTGEFDQRFGPDPAVRAAITQWLEERDSRSPLRPAIIASSAFGAPWSRRRTLSVW